jgi:hypothetical protein
MTTIPFSENLYFKQESNVNYYSTDNTNWNNISSLPITLTYTGLTTGNVYLTTDFNVSNGNFYFKIGSPNITFDGSNYNILMNGVTGYLGLFNNGTSLVNGYSNITIKNLSILNNLGTNTLGNQAGWFCQTYFSGGAINILLDNLKTNCIISSGGGGNGGICGRSCGYNYGQVIIQNCYTSGNITGGSSGGICGQSCSQAYGTVTITNCYSTGNITGANSGGICGLYCSENNGNVTIIDCYSSGNIIGNFTGGICGNSAGQNNGNVTISNCYSSGLISGSGAGGICSSNCGRNGGTATINNCYSTGNITGDGAGGIAGWEFGFNTNKSCQINKCYSTGIISGVYSGGIAGWGFAYNSNALQKINNCYSLGNITGVNAGGIVGAEVAYVDNNSYTQQVLISNCYSNGTVNAANNCGSICGGEWGNVYSKNVNVTIQNCYTIAGPFISPTLQSNVIITITNTYNQNGTWNSPTASTYLLNAPLYSGNTFVSNGSIYKAQTPTNNLTLPFYLNYDPTQETVLTNFNIPTPQIVGSIFTIVPPTSNREGPFEYSSSDSNIAEIIDNQYILMKNIGNDIVITATQPEIEGWTEGTINTTINVNQSTPEDPTIVTNSEQLDYALTNEYVTTILIENDISGVNSLINTSGTYKTLISDTNVLLLKNN